MTEPVPDITAPLVVEPEVVGRAFGLTTLTADQRQRITDAILDAMADAEAVVNRPLFASPATVGPVFPEPALGATNDPASWPNVTSAYDDWVSIVSFTETPAGSGMYEVAVLVGLDGPNNRILTRFVKAHATETLRHEPGSGFGKREVASVSADGQSVSYTGRGAGAGQGGGMAVGSLPSTKMLEPLRRRGVFKRNRAERPPWPYDDHLYTRRR